VLEVVHAHDQVELVLEVELRDVALLEAAVGQVRAPGDLVGPGDQVGFELDPGDLGLGVPLGELEAEHPGTAAGVQDRPVRAGRGGQHPPQPDAQPVGRGPEQVRVQPLELAAPGVERQLAAWESPHGVALSSQVSR